MKYSGMEFEQPEKFLAKLEEYFTNNNIEEDEEII